MARTTRASAGGELGLHGRVMSSLGQGIVEGDFRSGEILDLDELAEGFEVSRSVLREALRVLQSLGMIEARQRVGTQVLPRERWDLLNPQIIAWRGSGPDYFVQMRELIELRLGIEPVAAKLAATAMPDEDIVRVTSAGLELVRASAAGDGRAFLDADVMFHTVILRGAGNSVMAHFAGTVEALLRTREDERRFTITDYTPASADRHDALGRALAARDADAAYLCSYALLDATRDEFIAEAALRMGGSGSLS
ncbi:FCD domain-containing protein [Salinibacterium sp.]|uniref:FadR/GntR family transcriptional regulator n=1 Tax=Salinibacterium sp. TaxID=1915057 RepID=UPI00286CA433|nr:FCD domain-containing protein [Salinibacterium sp.]